jgi:hypothetical protein
MNTILKVAKTANGFVRPKKSEFLKFQDCADNARLCLSGIRGSCA